ncbi:MAG TPA: maleylpyruvate isomerase N-terminal domain-containing protein [Kribbellaceae bacterium]|nr:maleylpyruvate isomerase N-terminal domain-containing protein [Kribbellaceae bacterium]
MLTPDISATLYRGVRERVTAAARTLSADQLATVVPACPLWTVRDLLAHQAGVARDFVDGRVEGAPSPAWTAVHVDSRRDRPIGDVLDEWEEYGTQLEDVVRAGDRPGRLLNNPYVEAGVHCADLNAVIPVGRPDREVQLAALDFCLNHNKGDEPGILHLITEEAGYKVGGGELSAEVMVDEYELFRAVFGRRSAAQIEAWSWTGDASAWSTRLPRLPQTNTDQKD